MCSRHAQGLYPESVSCNALQAVFTVIPGTGLLSRPRRPTPPQPASWQPQVLNPFLTPTSSEARPWSTWAMSILPEPEHGRPPYLHYRAAGSWPLAALPLPACLPSPERRRPALRLLLVRPAYRPGSHGDAPVLVGAICHNEACQGELERKTSCLRLHSCGSGRRRPGTTRRL
jgi:hypothetical protein